MQQSFVQTVRLALLAGVGMAAQWPLAAQAQSVAIAASQTTPIATGTATGSGPADITVNSGISVSVTDGTIATVNSANVITNNGTLTSAGSTGVVGVLIDTGQTGSGGFINNGVVSITGTATGGTGNIGLWVNGPGGFVGNIGAATTSRITVTGANGTGLLLSAPVTGNVALGSMSITGDGSSGVVVAAPLTGNLQNYGAIGLQGSGSTGIAILAPVSGSIIQGGQIVVGSDVGIDTTGAAVAAKAGVAGVRIGASVGGGFVIDRYYVDASGVVQPPPASGTTTTNTLVTGSIVTYAGTPALLVAPAAGAPISLGAVGSGSDAYAIVNRGTLSGLGRTSGAAQSTLVVGATGLAPGSVLLAGGISNQTSATIAANATDALAVGIDLRSGAVVPALANAGTISAIGAQTAATSSTPASAGGPAVTVLVRSGAQLGSIVNNGTLNVQASGSNPAIAILDQSGTLTSISNSGTIKAVAASGQAARAIDLSTNGASVAIANSGTITGDIVGGSGNTAVALTGGTITGQLALGSGANSLTMSGGAVINGRLSSVGQLALSLSGPTTLDLSVGTAPTLSSLAMDGASTLLIAARSGQPGLTLTGSASFLGTSRLRVVVPSVASSQALTLITAAGGITTDHAATLVDTATIPFLYTLGAANVGTNSITVALARKSAAQVGLATGLTGFFNQSLVALANDSTLGPAIGNLATQDAVLAAYRVLAPASFSQAPLRMTAAMADAGSGAVAQRLTTIRLAGSRDEFGTRNNMGVWLQEYGNFLSQKDVGNQRGFSGNMLGLAVGIDKPLLGLDAVGVAFNFGWSDVGYGGISGKPLLITSRQVDIYAGKAWKGLFVSAVGRLGTSDFSSRRDFAFGTQSGTISANWSGTTYGATGSIGYAIKAGRLAITPSNSIAWTRLQQNGFTESGAGSLAVTLDKSVQTMTTNTAALAAEYLVPSGDGAWRVGLRGGYVSQLGTTPLALTGRFAGGGSDFVLNADALRPTEAQLGGQVGYVGPGWGAVLGYDRRQTSGFASQSIMATFRLVM